LKRRVLTIVLAALLAVLGAAGVLAYVHQANNRAVSGLKTVTVYQANTFIPAGTSLGEASQKGWLSTQKVPQGDLSATPVRTVNAGNRRLVVSQPGIGSGQLVLQAMLVNANTYVSAGGIAIPPGLVAVTVQLCLSEAVAGYVTGGSDVAVFATYAIAPKGSRTVGGANVQRTCDVSHQATYDNFINTRIVLPRAKVLAVGQSSSTAQGAAAGIAAVAATASGGQGNPPVLVTLALSQADAERLILIDEVALPYMALLSPASKTGYDSNNPLQLFRTH
jgi:Flp pilus assembly protein CpaB